MLSALTITGGADAALAVNAQENPARRMIVRNTGIMARIFIVLSLFFFIVSRRYPVTRYFPVYVYYYEINDIISEGIDRT